MNKKINKTLEDIIEETRSKRRHERRRIGKLLGVKIVGTNKPITKHDEDTKRQG